MATERRELREGGVQCGGWKVGRQLMDVRGMFEPGETLSST